MKNIIIIDYGYGNIYSILSAFKLLKFDVKVSNNPNEIRKADIIILPGVGAFKNAMFALKNLHIDIAIKEAINRGGYIVGICLGFQMLFDQSEEFGITKGLGLLAGKVTKLDNSKVKVPNVGWRNLIKSKNNFKNINFDFIKLDMVYFVHSYIPIASSSENILLYTQFGDKFLHASVFSNQILGFQFHPEKSGPVGLKILDITIRGLK
jgi:glutamine amidotransferase